MIYCDDVDLLRWEPGLFEAGAFGAQVLLSGTGDLDGTAFTIASGSLIDAQVEAGGVISLQGEIDASFPIVSVESATELTLSVLHGGVAGGEGTPVAVGEAAEVDFSVATFSAQARVVSDRLREAAGALGSAAGFEAVVILNPEALRSACALGTLWMIHSAHAAQSPGSHSARAAMYERLYREALRSARVEVDLNGDGEADEVRALNVMRMVRG